VEEMPQFGAGRNESWGNLDVLFYRWWIAVLQADRMSATHLAQLAPRVKPPASTVEAAYCWRLTDLVGDSRAVAVKAALERFDAEAGREVASLLPLREVVRQCAQSRSVQPWRMLLEDPLWSRRANFELTTWSDLYYRLQDEKES